MSPFLKLCFFLALEEVVSQNHEQPQGALPCGFERNTLEIITGLDCEPGIGF